MFSKDFSAFSPVSKKSKRDGRFATEYAFPDASRFPPASLAGQAFRPENA